MKKLYILASLLVAAIAVVSCEKNEIPTTPETTGIKVIVTAPTDTRAIVEPNGEGYSVKWSTTKEAEKIRIYYPKNGANDGKDDISINVDEDGKSGSFKLNNNKVVGETKVWVLYPLSAGKSGAKINLPYKASDDEIFASVASVQTCGADAPDPTQTLLFTSMEYPNPDSGVTVRGNFEHMVAYGKLNFTNLKGNKISQVKFSVNDENARIAIGTGAYNAIDKQFVVDETEEANPFKTITVNAPEGGIDNSGNVWFAAIPSYGVAYNDITIDVTVDGTTYTKTFKNANLKFNVGRVRPITVNMDGAAVK